MSANAVNGRGIGSIPRLGRSPGVGNSNVLQKSCLENSMARGALAGYMGVTKDLDSFEHTAYTWDLNFPRRNSVCDSCIARWLNHWITRKVPNVSINVSSVQFTLSVVSDSLGPYGMQHARPPCPSPIPGVYSNSCPLSRWCHPTISSSGFPFSSCPTSGAFPMSQFFTSDVQSIGI